jgi:hypothetical protein
MYISPKLFVPYLRRAIYDAQSRVIMISSLEHLMAVAYDDKGHLDRYVLLAFVDSSVPNCQDILDLEVNVSYQ